MYPKLINNNHKTNKCPLCNSVKICFKGNLKYAENLSLSTHSIKLLHKPELWKCQSCKSSFTQNAIPAPVAEELYSTGQGSKRWKHDSFESDKSSSVINYLKSHIFTSKKKLIDIGCNTGELLDFAKNLGIETFGLELCDESCEIIKKNGHKAFKDSKLVAETFDIVTAFDLLEHLYDINSFFYFVDKILNKSGYFVALTGNPSCISSKLAGSDWWYSSYPEHVIFISPSFFSSLEKFKLVDIIPCYASKTHETIHNDLKWKDVISKIVQKKYTGLPALSSDHQLIVLQKK